MIVPHNSPEILSMIPNAEAYLVRSLESILMQSVSMQPIKSTV